MILKIRSAGDPVLRGRAHIYEGNTPQQAVLPLRTLRLLGAEIVMLTNAAGGLDPALSAGDLMVLSDHIGLPTLVGNNPLFGPNDERFGPRFPAMTDAYDAELRALAHRVAEARGVELRVVVARLLCFSYRSANAGDPFAHDGGDAVAHDTEASIEFERSSGEEAAALEHPFFDEHQPVIDQ